MGENVTYFFTVNNLGPASTSAASLSFTLPMGASLRGVLSADNWNCNIMNQTVTCLRQSALARGQTSELQLLVSPPADATEPASWPTSASRTIAGPSPAITPWSGTSR